MKCDERRSRRLRVVDQFRNFAARGDALRELMPALPG